MTTGSQKRDIAEIQSQLLRTSDAFGRFKTSDPFTVFDSKQLHDNQPLFWDDAEVSGSGTGTSWSADRASTTISVSATTAGKRVRQTYQHFNYQPGKSQLILMTGVLAGGVGSGLHAGMGLHDDENGVFVETEDSEIYMTIRSKVTGSVVDNRKAQSEWNGDKLDGTGPSGITLNPAKAQIFWCDLEWLGVGSVRTGFVIGGVFITCHTFHHANIIDSVYMSTPNLPLRYFIENDGTGAAGTLEHICATVISEGGQQAVGQLHYVSTEGTHADCATADTLYALIALRLTAGEVDQQIDVTSISMLNATTDDFEWQIVLNPTVSGLSYSAVANSTIEAAVVSGSAPTVTGGTPIAGGFVKSSGNAGDISANILNAWRLGSSIAGVSDVLVVCCRPLSANADIDAAIGWRELS